MKNPADYNHLQKVLVWCGLVSYFLCFVVVVAMPHHEPGHEHFNETENSNSDRDSQNSPAPAQLLSMEEPSVVMVPGAGVDITNNETSSLPATTDATLIPGDSTMETAREPTFATSMAGEMVNTPIPTMPTMTIQFILNEINSPPVVESEGEFERNKSADDIEAPTVEEFPLNSITPTIAAPKFADMVVVPSSQPLSLPPSLPAAQPVIDPISLQNDDDVDNGAFPSSTVTTYPASFENLSFIIPGASSPSIQLIAPPQTSPSSPSASSSSPDIPREPEHGQLPESPEPDSLQPYNLHDIPISLVSLSGNSGGSTSDMATFSSLASATDNVPVDFTRFRYHVVTGQLFKIGSTGKGICPENMRFFAVPGHPRNGACDCDYYQCSRPLIYSSERHQCYWAWSQGPCEKGEWFIFDKDLRRRGKCEGNPCSFKVHPNSTSSYSSSGSEYIFQNPDDATCYLAGTQGYCPDADERLLIYPGEPIPKCRKFTLCFPLTVPQELQCVYGNKYFVESAQCQ